MPLRRRPLNSCSAKAGPSPLRIIRIKRAADLFGVSLSTIWRWYKTGVLPPPIVLSPAIKGWREETLLEFLKEREAAS